MWQVKAGTIFDNVLITDDPAYAKKIAKENWKVTYEGEKKMKEAQDEEERKKEENDKKVKEEQEDDDDEDDDDNDVTDKDGTDKTEAEEVSFIFIS